MSDRPILPGFHPDPSICRVGDTYVLITSSFEYFPGVPVFTSRDLVTWEQVGNALDRPTQLAVGGGRASASTGIYAPTIRFHSGRYWITTTDIRRVAEGHLIVHAEDPAGPWSDPVYTAGLIGIDPDLVWDDEGQCRLTWSDVVRGGISQARIDPATGAVLSSPVEIWRGSGGAHVEGPHLHRRGDWWYLVTAEGGTSTGHMVTVARSRAVDGPFEAHPGGPILTHRSTSHPVQSTGHADLVERPDGSWALVHLGTRIRGSFPRWHTNGRETFLAGVDWVDDWPVAGEDRFEVPAVDGSFVDDFTAPALDPRWVSPCAVPAQLAHPGPDGLVLDAGREPGQSDAAGLIGVRAVDENWEAGLEAEGDIALSVRIDDAHQALVERVGDEIRARIVIGPLDQIRDAGAAAAHAALVVRSVPFGGARGSAQGPDRLVLGYDADGFVALAELDGRYLSTEVAGGFTGRVIGIEALGAPARVTRFSYAAG